MSGTPAGGEQRATYRRVVAIDGPAGAGKSTVARLVAAAVGLAMLDTGALYRCVAWAALRAGVDPADTDAVAAIARRAVIEQRGEAWFVDNEDVSAAIRGPEVTAAVSTVAAHPEVRSQLVLLQRAWLDAHGGGVLEGRDIGSVVVPDALLKVFLDADPTARASRRALEDAQRAGRAQPSTDDVRVQLDAIGERDKRDSSRRVAPLTRAVGATVVDTTALTIDEVVANIVELWRAAVERETMRP